MRKRFLSITLALTMLFACVSAASAASVIPPDGITDTTTSTASTAAPDNPIDGTRIFDILRISHIVMDQTATSNGTRAWSDYFDTTDEDPAYRVWVENTGDHSIKLYVKRGSASSDDIMAGPITIAAGESDYVELTTDNATNKPGRRWVVINPIAGNSFEATVRVRIAPSLGELG